MPAASASRGPAKVTGTPLSAIVPASAWYTPARIFNSVDLPAPFSPASACTFPAASEKSTPERTRVPLKLLTIPRISTPRNAGVGIVKLALSRDCTLTSRASRTLGLRPFRQLKVHFRLHRVLRCDTAARPVNGRKGCASVRSRLHATPRRRRSQRWKLEQTPRAHHRGGRRHRARNRAALRTRRGRHRGVFARRRSRDPRARRHRARTALRLA